MATCIKTGAFVYFKDYGFAAAADLFECGDQVLIQWMPHGRHYNVKDLPRTISHEVQVGHGYHHEDRGVTVVPRERVEYVR